MKRLAIAVLAALALVAAGCGGSDTVDTAQVEDQVQEEAEDRDLQVDRVSCPDEITAEQGEEFDCEVELEGGDEIDAEVTLRDDSGERLRINIDDSAVAQEETTPEEQAPAEDTSQDAQLVEQAIRSFVTAARDGDAATFCGQQSDPRLARRYGDINECVESDEATTPAPAIPSGDDINIEIQSLTPPTATVEVSRPGGSTTSTYEMVDEGGQGGWAIESIDGE